MKKPDAKVLQALCLFKTQHPDEYRVLQQWFIDSSSEQDQTMRSAEPPHMLYRAQGGSKEILAICDIFASPQELLAKVSMKQAGIHSIPT